MLVLLAAFFAACEAALVSVSRLHARALAERRVRGARNLQDMVDDKTAFLTSVLVGNTIVLLAADSLATYLAISLKVPCGAVLSTIVMTAIFLLFGEIMPKTVATGDSERWALRLALPDAVRRLRADADRAHVPGRHRPASSGSSASNTLIVRTSPKRTFARSSTSVPNSA